MENSNAAAKRKWLAASTLMAVGISACVMLRTATSTPTENEDYADRISLISSGIRLKQNDQSTPLRRRLQEHLSPLPQAPAPFTPEPSALQQQLQQQQAEQPPLQVSRDKYLGTTFPLPEKMPMYLRNTMDHSNENDLVFFWHIPKTAGLMMKTMMGTCFGLRRAEKLIHPASMEMIKDTVLNVDTATPAGIVEAQNLNIADSGMVDVIISSFALSASSLFTKEHRGRAFTLLRHPVDNAASNFVKRKGRSKELRELDIQLHQYVSQDWYPDNYMVRQLTGVLPGVPLTENHMDLAKNILSAKFFVGIVEQMGESVRQLKLYYNWKEQPGMEGCTDPFVRGQHEAFKLKNRQKPAKGSDEWNMILEKEKFDLELYYFGLEMFSRQARLYPTSMNPESYF